MLVSVRGCCNYRPTLRSIKSAINETKQGLCYQFKDKMTGRYYSLICNIKQIMTGVEGNRLSEIQNHLPKSFN